MAAESPAQSLLRALLFNGVVACTFGVDVAIARVLRLVSPAHDLTTTFEEYLIALFSQAAPPVFPQNAITFIAHDALNIPSEDKRWVWVHYYPSLSQPAVDLWQLWSLADIVCPNPTNIIPSRLFVPYAGTRREEITLMRTDMLPIFFARVDGAFGIPIAEEADYSVLPDTLTRIRSAHSLKVTLNLINYSRDERQIQFYPAGTVSMRRLASLVASKVRSCLASAERQNDNIIKWEDPRYKIGSGPGYIGIADVLLLGVVFVSVGKITPLLQVRPGFSEHIPKLW